MKYDIIQLYDEISIKGIYTLVYQEKSSDFLFEGESHDFWELIYVDKGFLYLLIDDKGYKVNQGEMFFFNRNQNHIVWSDSRVGPCFLTISFDMDFPFPKALEYKRFILSDSIKDILKKIIVERKLSYEGDVTSNIDPKKQRSVPFCHQMLRIYLAELIINIYRNCKPEQQNVEVVSTIRKKTEEIIYNKAVEYVQNNIFNKIMISDVCGYVSISHTQLNRVFNRIYGNSIGEYIVSKKLEKAKDLICKSGMNITQISEELSFSSVHYFSRLFKKRYNISPREYSYSIRISS